MMNKYYLDTSIYIDYYENRTDKFRPLGDWAHRLLALIETKNEILLVSDFLVRELENHFSKQEVNLILQTYKDVIEKIEVSEKQFNKAFKLSIQRNVPVGDAVHAIVARDASAILVARDKHFLNLTDISVPFKPEDII